MTTLKHEANRLLNNDPNVAQEHPKNIDLITGRYIKEYPSSLADYYWPLP